MNIARFTESEILTRTARFSHIVNDFAAPYRSGAFKIFWDRNRTQIARDRDKVSYFSEKFFMFFESAHCQNLICMPPHDLDKTRAFILRQFAETVDDEPA